MIKAKTNDIKEAEQMECNKIKYIVCIACSVLFICGVAACSISYIGKVNSRSNKYIGSNKNGLVQSSDGTYIYDDGDVRIVAKDYDEITNDDIADTIVSNSEVLTDNNIDAYSRFWRKMGERLEESELNKNGGIQRLANLFKKDKVNLADTLRDIVNNYGEYSQTEGLLVRKFELYEDLLNEYVDRYNDCMNEMEKSKITAAEINDIMASKYDDILFEVAVICSIDSDDLVSSLKFIDSYAMFRSFYNEDADYE